MSIRPESVVEFWFPAGLDRDAETHRRQLEWWFRGGANAEIQERFGPICEAALRGELDSWADTPRGRLALIIALDQFPRGIFPGDARAYSGDGAALGWAVSGIDEGLYARLEPVWERLFFFLPLSHSESPPLHERAVALSRSLLEGAPRELADLYRHAARQAEGHREVVAHFGRHPHRNPILGRQSTPEELEYIARGEFVHQRKIPD